jgi:hypothetical protein
VEQRHPVAERAGVHVGAAPAQVTLDLDRLGLQPRNALVVRRIVHGFLSFAVKVLIG